MKQSSMSILKIDFNNKIIFGLSIALIALMILNSYNATSYYTPDEYYQIIEFASYKLNISSEVSLPWEYKEKIRQGIQPFLAYSFFSILKWVNIHDTSIQLFILRIFNSLFTVCCLAFFAFTSKNSIATRYQRAYFILLFSFWVVPTYFFRFSQEIVAQNIYLIIVGILFYKNLTNKNFFLVGILVGLAFLIRFQSIISFLGIILWFLIDKPSFNKLNFYKLTCFTLGFIGIFILGIFMDYWLYNQFVFVFYRYLYYNIILGIANGFGTQSVFFYFLQIIKLGTPLFGIVLFLSCIVTFIKKQFNLPFIIFSTNVVLLSMISHKEERFLFVVYLFIPFILIYIYQFNPFKNQKIEKFGFKLFFLVNIFIIFLSTMFHSQLLTDNEKSLQKYLIENYKNKSFELYYTGSCHPFMDKVKIDMYKDTQFLYHNFLMPKTYSDYDFKTTNKYDTTRINLLYVRKSIYLDLLSQKTFNLKKSKIVKQSIPLFLDQFLDKYSFLGTQFNESVIYLVVF